MTQAPPTGAAPTSTDGPPPADAPAGTAVERLSVALARIVTVVGRTAAWVVVLLCLITVFDVITRRFLVLGSIVLQELEWYLHTILFMLTIGFGYIANAHVRVDLIRDRLKPKHKSVLEIVGCVLFLLPFGIVLLYFSWDLFMRSFAVGESSPHAAGIPYRWLIKAILPIGFALLLAAGVSIALKHVAAIRRPPADGVTEKL
jgi:TRAP-type mannitol/chloroaromatic compound transport system permease small subunit